MKSREERIAAEADDLRKTAGHPDSNDRKYWAEAAKRIDEEDRRIADASVDEPSRLTQPAAERRGPWPTNDPVGLDASRKQK